MDIYRSMWPADFFTPTTRLQNALLPIIMWHFPDVPDKAGVACGTFGWAVAAAIRPLRVGLNLYVTIYGRIFSTEQCNATFTLSRIRRASPRQAVPMRSLVDYDNDGRG